MSFYLFVFLQQFPKCKLKKTAINAFIAQSVERVAVNHKVIGSSPIGSDKYLDKYLIYFLRIEIN